VTVALAAAWLGACSGDDTSQLAIQTVYSPYPAGILPPDLDSEIARVRAENKVIFQRTIDEWKALSPVVFAGNPPTPQGTGYDAIRVLGTLLNFDENMSVNKDKSCSSCHMPYVGFGAPIPSLNLTTGSYPGTFAHRFGKRTPQRYTYATYFPVLQYNDDEQLFFGGNFWDARATGVVLQSPNAEQAQHPPVDPDELGFADTACITFRLSQAVYRPLFEALWGTDLLDIDWPANTDTVCATPQGATTLGDTTTPVQLSSADRTKSDTASQHVAQAISFYENTPRVNPFSSKFDAFLAGNYTLTDDEQAGYDLFRGKANCNSCHLDGRGAALNSTDTSDAANVTPLFTCFGYANLGLPLNASVAFFYETQADSVGFTPNPLGFGYRDLGLGTFLRSGFGSAPNPNAAWAQDAPSQDGAMQVMTARNVAMTPAACPTTEAGRVDGQGKPVPYFQKAFFHNGYAKSLKQLVHFYNTRDKFAYPVTSGHCPAGTTEKVDCWPQPEVPNNIDMTFGDLGLTDQEEDQIVVFMETLTDGFSAPFANADTFTGTCMTYGAAATQGNEQIVPVPTLPPCADEICGVAPVPSPAIP
jgi:cytochrome c peroxidase